MEIRKVGNKVMKVTYVQPESPAAVMARDCVPRETVGSRPMIMVATPHTLNGIANDMSVGRIAPSQKWRN